MNQQWEAAVGSEAALYQYFLLEHAPEVLDKDLTEDEWSEFVGWAQDSFADEATALVQHLWQEFKQDETR